MLWAFHVGLRVSVKIPLRNPLRSSIRFNSWELGFRVYGGSTASLSGAPVCVFFCRPLFLGLVGFNIQARPP